VNRQLPKRFRDVRPEPLPPLPPSGHIPNTNLIPSPSTLLPAGSPTLSSTIPVASGSLIPRISRTPRNAFGLIRQYLSGVAPTHDPEEYVNWDDLSDGAVSTEVTIDPLLNGGKGLYPYPNRSTFLLGDWYWNNGAHKSQKSFHELRRIIGNPDFRPEDIRSAEWNKIDAKLGSNDFDEDVGTGGDNEWMDQDAGWRRTPISISVPFHSRAKFPGVKDYLVGDFYHRSLVAVIREKIANGPDVRHFHYEPFQLLWDRFNGQTSKCDVRVHGELYTSPVFLDAHCALQESPGEPGCDLPRVVVALMFWSDATHLTTFGTAKLWPCYLYFGNESKYNRCKPSRHLCNHVAYFQAVSFSILLSFNKLRIDLTIASRYVQGLRYRKRWPRAEQ
jgi:hypothetical protein